MYKKDIFSHTLLMKFLNSSCKNCVINVSKKWTLQMLIPQFPVLVLKWSSIYTVSLNTVHIFDSPKSVLSGDPLYICNCEVQSAQKEEKHRINLNLLLCIHERKFFSRIFFMLSKACLHNIL